MAERLTFHFEGAQADDHRMNFYEAARFQYGAARLLVKLAQFRETGKFADNISHKSNPDIELVAQKGGSFNYNVEDYEPKKDDFLNISLSDLVAYVAERVVEKISESALKGIEIASLGDDEGDDASGPNLVPAEIDELADAVLSGDSLTASLPPETSKIIKRRVAEIHRERRLATAARAVAKISDDQSQKLVAMAAPLIVEMGTALRKSATTLEITTQRRGPVKSVLFLDRKMAREIETAVVDRQITPILGDITQFNKENGWGKLRIEEGVKTVSFSVPSDVLPDIRQVIIDNMKKDLVNFKVYFVRDRAGKVKRLIIVGILPSPSR
ncbi:hypothetical protein [Sphingomonas sp. BK069]|uniref:hypothetical protein n=1 Tax=Sphingomonas sp. BK069 TaxID=2586979 RepID=UPI00161A1BBA|nr:hypothetical protein [Sphingomonas sp. BK069]MBB3346021.1 hypothetical protein [Sphingomonas sp. BK069]